MNENRILLAHGAGGVLTHRLIREIFKEAFSNTHLDVLDDAAVFENHNGTLALTTDSYVIQPLFFPGGDIGRLSVCGTVNDLAMKGAKPLYLSASYIIEEGLEIAILKKIVTSMSTASREAGVTVITGDTKVVEKGKADGIFITTAGVGEILSGVNVSGRNACPGDKIILSGSVGDHSIAVLNARANLGLQGEIKSDCAPLNKIIEEMLTITQKIHTFRDPTRGGLATTLNEIADQSNIGIFIEENNIPVNPAIKSACEILGFDPLYLANEGKFVLFLPPAEVEKVLPVLTKHSQNQAAVIGEVVEFPKGVYLNTAIGGRRRLLMLEGDPLPRIC